MKNAHKNILEPKVTSTNALFCPTNSSKPKNIQLTTMSDPEKQDIVTFENRIYQVKRSTDENSCRLMFCCCCCFRFAVSIYFTWLHSRGNGHQKLVEASEEDVGHVADPDVVRGAHEEQQTRLHCRDHTDDQLGPDVPTDFHKASDEGRYRTCREIHGQSRLLKQLRSNKKKSSSSLHC